MDMVDLRGEPLLSHSCEFSKISGLDWVLPFPSSCVNLVVSIYPEVMDIETNVRLLAVSRP